MSVDTYLCFCCMSTTGLSPLQGISKERNFAEQLKELFSITITGSADDNYICMLCAFRLKDIYTFRKQIYNTLRILDGNGLINLNKLSDTNEYIVSRVSNDTLQEENDRDFKTEYLDLASDQDYKSDEDTKDMGVDLFTIKDQDIKDNKLEGIILPNSVILESLLTDPSHKKVIDNDTTSRVTVQKRKNTNDKHSKVTDVKVNVTELKTRERNTKEGIDNVMTGLKLTIDKSGVVKSKPHYVVTDDLTCPVCSSVSKNVYLFHQHMKLHYPNHVCDTCGKSFVTRKSLVRHHWVHKEGPFKCLTCGEVFRHKNTLNAHKQRKHTTVGLYACPRCDCRFPDYHRRALHLDLVHGEKANHGCEVCGKKFLTSASLSMHMRAIHLKVKRHFCTECDHAYFTKSHLTDHMIARHNGSRYQCDMCEKTYTTKFSLKIHHRSHLDDRRYSCEACGKKFLQKSSLLKHKKKHEKPDYID